MIRLIDPPKPIFVLPEQPELREQIGDALEPCPLEHADARVELDRVDA